MKSENIKTRNDIFHDLREQTIEEEMVEELVGKINPDNPYRVQFTFLHDHERELLSGFVLDHEPDNENAQQAKEDDPYDLQQLSRDAKRHLK